LTEHPEDWETWKVFWDVRYQTGAAPAEEFRLLAERLASEHRDLGEPLVAEALGRVWEHDYSVASRLLQEAARRSGGADVGAAPVIVALAGLDGAGAQRALAELERSRRDLYDLMRRHGADELAASLAARRAAAGEEVREVSQFLLGLARDTQDIL